MSQPGRKIQLGDLVVCAHEEASRLMQDPEVASMLACWVVKRVLGAESNRHVAVALAEAGRDLAPVRPLRRAA
jgi:hypothetical protein